MSSNCSKCQHLQVLTFYLYLAHSVIFLVFCDSRFWSELNLSSEMPRKYFQVPAADSRHHQYNSDSLRQAVDQVIAGGMSSYKAASAFNVPRGTVAWHLAYYTRTGRRLKIGEGQPTVLSYDEESLLVTIIQTRASAGFLMDKSDVTSLIAEYIPYVGKDRAFPRGKPGSDWYTAFVKRWRNEITLRKPELLTSVVRLHAISQLLMHGFPSWARN